MKPDDTPSLIGTWLLLVVLIAALVLLFERTLAYQRSVVLEGAPEAPSSRGAPAFGAGPDAAGRNAPGERAMRAPGTSPVPAPGDAVVPARDSAAAPAGGEASNAPTDSASIADRGITTAESLDALRLLLAEAAALEATSDSAEEGAGWRPRDLAVLTELSGAIRFPRDSAVPDERTSEILDSVAAVLMLHPETPVTVEVGGGGERSDAARDRVLRRERGRAIIAALVERGLAFTRFSIEVADDAEGSSDTPRIRIVAGERTRADR